MRTYSVTLCPYEYREFENGLLRSMPARLGSDSVYRLPLNIASEEQCSIAGSQAILKVTTGENSLGEL